jgi:glutamate-1-semialdehyde 2,1-aminomutase
MKSIGNIITRTKDKKSLIGSAVTHSYRKRLHSVIPGGAHTYSRGDDQFPSNAPSILESGKGCKVYCPEGKEYLDFGMGLRSISIGYAEHQINSAVIAAIEKGNNLTRASTIELEAAETLVSLIESADMVKFCKNGSNATTAAIKLARAYTGKSMIARCKDDPFLSFDDWFIGSTLIKRGVLESTIGQTKYFKYNDIDSLKSLLENFPDKFACVIMEPASFECPSTQQKLACCENSPCNRFPNKHTNFLKQVETICKQNNIVFILDETITGFRWNMGGAQKLYGVRPDLSTFGKSMANGFSVAALAGRRELMQLGGIEITGMQRTFLLSSTHGAEMAGLAAFLATQKFMIENNVVQSLWNTGYQIKNILSNAISDNKLEELVSVSGPAVSPIIQFFDVDGSACMKLKTLFAQEMLKRGILIPWISICYRHESIDLHHFKNVVDSALSVCKKAIEDDIANFLQGDAAKPVFREYN